MTGTKIKICGLFRQCDADAVNEAMPDYAGFVFHAKSRRAVTEETAEKLRSVLHPAIETVGVFVDASLEQIERLYRNKIISIIQLHGNEDAAMIEQLRKCIPKVVIWQAFKIQSKADLQKAEESSADKILLDHGAGTGVAFDWSLLDGISRDFILAGGLSPNNIPFAIAKHHPDAVDLSSGVETDGVKDREKIMAAVTAARRS